MSEEDFIFVKILSQYRLQSNGAELMEWIEPLVSGTWSFMGIFFLCEIGEKLTESFEKFNNDFRLCNWYAFSNEVQRMFLIVLLDSQYPVIIRGYGNTLCTRYALKTVIF